MDKTVIEVFRQTRSNYANEEAICFKKGHVAPFDLGKLLSHGEKFCEGDDFLWSRSKKFVSILSQNRYEWVVADLASICTSSPSRDLPNKFSRSVSLYY